MLCISTSFQVLHALKIWSKHFFGHFQPFLFISNIFSDFLLEIRKKLLKTSILMDFFIMNFNIIFDDEYDYAFLK